VRASLKESGNGIMLEDTSGGSGSLIIADAGSTTAAELGIAGSFGVTVAQVRGANMQRQWVNENTVLKTYNGGRGVTAGKFTITNSNGVMATIDLTSTDATLGDVIKKINAASIDVTASINANGDGLLLTDTAGGASSMVVKEVSGRTASDLNIAGTATANAINGSFEKTITLDATDTLDTVTTKINALAFAISASAINDGSGQDANHLSITSRFSGLAGRFVFDAGDTNLAATNLVEAQDAVVFFGGSGAAKPMVITSSTNQLTDVIRGLTINLQGASGAPVTLTVADSNSGVVDQIKSFVDTFNGLVDQIASVTKFDNDASKRGVLQGDVTVQQIQSRLYGMVQRSVAGSGNVRRLSDVGLTLTDGAKLEFDEAKFQSAYADDPENVKRFFTLYQTSGGTIVKGAASQMYDEISRLVDPVNGMLTLKNSSIDSRITEYQKSIDNLDILLTAKRTRLELQFSNMETILSQLQNQQKALDSFTPISYSSSSSSSSS
jgi:flagellar hook-associated protein 2